MRRGVEPRKELVAYNRQCSFLHRLPFVVCLPLSDTFAFLSQDLVWEQAGNRTQQSFPRLLSVKSFLYSSISVPMSASQQPILLFVCESGIEPDKAFLRFQ